ncbi:MAG: class F sortase [Pseudonocardia sp.]|nr:class F sortase [Pseudonocardia sp.]
MISRRRWPAVFLALLGLALLVTGVVLVTTGGQAPRVGSTAVGDVPSAAPVPAPPVSPAQVSSGQVSSGQVAPPVFAGEVPVRLDLPDRAVTAPVVPVGTGPDGALFIPDPPQTVGWWAPGALAGSGTGTVVVAGHVDSRLAGIGALAVLPDLTVGEHVVLTGERGAVLPYRVVARREFVKAALPPETFDRAGAPRLVLITCGGRFDRSTRSYEDNIVVYAEPVA